MAVKIDGEGPTAAATLREDRTVEVVATDDVSGSPRSSTRSTGRPGPRTWRRSPPATPR
ncbi:hypothetical protein NKG05_22325 [Oerskovia sp. M15]